MTTSKLRNLKDRESNSWVGKIRDAYEIHEAGTPQYRLGLWKCLFQTQAFRSSFELIPSSDQPESETWIKDEETPKIKNVGDSIDKSSPTLIVKRGIPTSLPGLRQRLLSKSYITELDSSSQEKLLTQIDLIWNQEVVGKPSVEWLDKQTVDFPYVTHLYLMRKR